jgi:predicted RNase H-like nuclease (RuvC/YqgF family)
MEGIEAFITDEAGEKMLAPEGDHSWENEDGSMTVITVDGNGIITGIQEVEPTPAEDEESAVDAEVKEIEEAMRKILKDSEMRFNAVEANNAALKSTIEKMETQIKQLCTELDAYVDGGQKFKRKEQSGERDWKKFSK